MAVVVLVLSLLLCEGLVSDARSLQTHSVVLPDADADEHDNRWQATERALDSWRRPAGIKDSSYNRSRRSKRHYRAFVGVMTGYRKAGLAANIYKGRRDALRATWFPSSHDELLRWEEDHGIVIRFIIGKSDDEAQNLAIDAEAAQHKDFLRLNIQEDYLKFSNKTRTFFRAAVYAYSADWYIKMDDDLYLRPDRLLTAVDEWDQNKADYTGCMNRNALVVKNPDERWYEHSHQLIGDHYWPYFKGAMYAVRAHAVKTVVVNNFKSLRLLQSNEDACLGLWMLGHDIKHFEDRRMCDLQCTNTTVAVIPDYWTDIEAQYMHKMHAKDICRH